MADANHNAKLFRQLTALVRGSRTFAHRNRPLYWHEVRRLETLGFRYLSQAYGNDSPYGATFRRFIEEAFLPLYVFSGPNRDGFFEKEGFELLEKDPERIYYLDKLSFRHALQILIEAAHRVREDMRRQCKPSPADALVPGSLTANDSPQPSAIVNNREAGAAVRFASTITSPIAAKQMEVYMKSKGIGQEEFARQARTTGRTLRQFMKTGKVRRRIFDGIAEAMGKTKEELMKSE